MIDEAVQLLLLEDKIEGDLGTTPTEPYEARLVYLRDALGIPPEHGRSASRRFNLLPLETRHAFYRMCVDCLSMQDALNEGLGPREVLEGHLLVAFTTLGGRGNE